MHEDIPLAGHAQHTDTFLGSIHRVKAMLPKSAGMRIVRMLMHQVAGHGQRMRSRGRESEDTTQRVFIDKKIACSECQIVPGYGTSILKAIFGVQVTDDGTPMTFEVFSSDQYCVLHLESKREVCSILKLVAHIAAQVGHMPAHAERRS